MPLDASIPLQVRGVQLDNPQDIRAKALSLQAMQRQADDADRADADQRTLRDLYRQSTKADGTVDSTSLLRGVAQAGLGDRIPAMQKAQMDARKSSAESDTSELALHKKRLDILNGGLSALLAKPNVTHDDVIAQINSFVNQGLIEPAQGAEAARNTPGRPEQLRPFLVQRALEAADASKQLEALLPKYDEQDVGGSINVGTIDPLTATRTPGANVPKTMTPDARATQAHQRDTSFGSSEGDLLAALAEQGVSLPAGMRSKEQQLATVRSLISRNPAMSADEIARKVGTGQIGFNVDKKETSTAAGISGKIRYAENEIQNIAPVIREASQLVPRGSFVPWNKLKQMGESSISDPNLKQLKSYMNTLSNAYDMLAARGGTDQEKRSHNRAMFDTADSPEALDAALQAVENEAALSDRAGVSSTQRRAPPSIAAPAIPADIAALLQKHGAK